MKTILEESLNSFFSKKAKEILSMEESKPMVLVVLKKSEHFLASLKIYENIISEEVDVESQKLFTYFLIGSFERSISSAKSVKDLLWFKEILDGNIIVPDFLLPYVLKYATEYFLKIAEKEVSVKYKFKLKGNKFLDRK